jgi:hypothetical protein
MVIAEVTVVLDDPLIIAVVGLNENPVGTVPETTVYVIGLPESAVALS